MNLLPSVRIAARGRVCRVRGEIRSEIRMVMRWHEE